MAESTRTSLGRPQRTGEQFTGVDINRCAHNSNEIFRVAAARSVSMMKRAREKRGRQIRARVDYRTFAEPPWKQTGIQSLVDRLKARTPKAMAGAMRQCAANQLCCTRQHHCAAFPASRSSAGTPATPAARAVDPDFPVPAPRTCRENRRSRRISDDA